MVQTQSPISNLVVDSGTAVARCGSVQKTGGDQVILGTRRIRLSAASFRT